MIAMNAMKLKSFPKYLSIFLLAAFFALSLGSASHIHKIEESGIEKECFLCHLPHSTMGSDFSIVASVSHFHLEAKLLLQFEAFDYSYKTPLKKHSQAPPLV